MLYYVNYTAISTVLHRSPSLTLLKITKSHDCVSVLRFTSSSVQLKFTCGIPVVIVVDWRGGLTACFPETGVSFEILVADWSICCLAAGVHPVIPKFLRIVARGSKPAGLLCGNGVRPSRSINLNKLGQICSRDM